MDDIKNSFIKDDLILFNSDSQQIKAIVIAGPTACGKSRLAIDLAQLINGVILNADSMQVYKDVPTLTARPSMQDEKIIPHKLYGFLEPQSDYNAFKWVKQVNKEVKEVFNQGKIPIIVGGTGFYLQTLLNGISYVPEVSLEVRKFVRQRFEDIGQEAFLNLLKQQDRAFVFQDKQRMMRAFEVLEQTGKSITYWQSLGFEKIVKADFYTCFVNPERQGLYQRCNARFEEMMKQNILEEIETLFKKNPPETSLILKAIGLREIKDYLDGITTKEDAILKAQQLTRNYAKRQITWFKHRFFSNTVLLEPKIQDLLTKVLHFLG